MVSSLHNVTPLRREAYGAGDCSKIILLVVFYAFSTSRAISPPCAILHFSPSPPNQCRIRGTGGDFLSHFIFFER